NHSILSNRIWGVNQDTGLNLFSADNTLIQSNRIYKNANDGLRLVGDATNNRIVRNVIYSNGTYGLILSWGDIRRNYIISNEMSGPMLGGMDQDFGIALDSCRMNYIRYNKVHHHTQYGFNLSTDCRSNYISHNTVYSNNMRQIFVQNDTADYNSIMTNDIQGDFNDVGVEIQFGNYNVISSNRFRNSWYGVYLHANASNNFITRNSISENLIAGIWIQDDICDNNFIANNEVWGANQRHGIYVLNSDRNTLRSNIVHHNATNGIVLLGNAAHNLLTRNTVYSNNISGIMVYSNNAVHNSVLSNNIWGLNQNQGILLSYGDVNTMRSNYIHHNQAYGIRVDNSAVSNFFILNRLNFNVQYGLYINSDTADNNFILSNNIAYNSDKGIYLDSGDRNLFRYNSVRSNSSEGVYLANSAASNCFTHNALYANNNMGLFISSANAMNNLILTNDVYGIAGLQDYGIGISTAVKNTIKSNRMHHNVQSAVYLESGAMTNYIANNKIYSNLNYGVWVADDTSDNNYIMSNTITGLNQGKGIYVVQGDNEQIWDNIIINNMNNGIWLSSSASSVVKGNIIANHSATGLFSSNSSPFVYLNTFTNNASGVCFILMSCQIFEKNNLQTNFVRSFTNGTGTFMKLTNNWWGTTIASRIASKIGNNGGYSNFTPYRLFKPYDITPGADTDRLAAITWATAIVTGNNVELKWTRPSDTSDFTRYFVYRSTTPGTTNLSLSSLVWQTNSATGTNHWESGLTMGSNYYYHITSLDGYPPPPVVLTNESWYSAEAVAQIAANTGPFYVDDNSGNDGNPGTFSQPFLTLQRAANAMMPGVPSCTSATTYVFPGRYLTKAVVRSNKNPGYMVFTKLSNTSPVMNGSLLTNYGIKITNASRILISGLSIGSYINGIIISGTATNNIIQRNTIYSNDDYGVFINSDTAYNISILKNDLGRNNTGINLNNDRNTIWSNNIYNNAGSSIWLTGSAASNYISRNTCSTNGLAVIALYTDDVDNNFVLSNSISGATWGVQIQDGDRNTVRANYVFNNFDGIILMGSITSNYISRNMIYSNDDAGIYLDSDSTNKINCVFTNNLRGNVYGIAIYGGGSFMISSNNIHNNLNHGIYLSADATSNYISRNTICSNDQCGIYFDFNDADNNFISSNNIWGVNQNNGIFISLGDKEQIIDNIIHDNQTNGIWMSGSTNSVIRGNRILGHPGAGIGVESSFSSFYLNSISSNLYGVYLGSGLVRKFEKNNLSTNIRCAFTNNNVTLMKVTNNWWGTTIASRIASKIRNNGGYSNFTAYRLFKPYDITLGADTDRLAAITWATAVVTGNSVQLMWTRPSDTSDFTRYFVYRSTTPGTTNLSLSSLVWQTNSATGTNHWESGLTYGSNYYYHITSLDDPGAPNVLTNESWYSVQAAAQVLGYTGPYYVDDDSGLDTNPGTFSQPFWTLQRAANAMMAGAPGCTSATTYVFPGLYTDKITIASNKNTDFMVFTKLSNDLPLLDGSLVNTNGFTITNASRVIINGFLIIKFTENGIRITGRSTNNQVRSCTIRSNLVNGIYLDSPYARNNILAQNLIYSSNQDIGIVITDSDNNTIRSNQVHHHSVHGMRLLGNASSNYIVDNNVYENNNYGISIAWDSADNNMIYTNHIWGSTQDIGILIWDGDNNIVRSNQIHNHANRGIDFHNSATGNRIEQNSIYSNDWEGIQIDTEDSRHNYILNNDIWSSNQDRGILVFQADGNTISGNRIRGQREYGLYIAGSVSNTYVSRNSIWSNEGYGICIISNSTFNNRFLTNAVWGRNQDYGIYLFDARDNTFQSNRIYDHLYRGIGIFSNATGNVFRANEIFSNSFDGIFLQSDRADNNYFINNTLYGSNQFRGILIADGDNNQIRSNRIYNNKSRGVYLAASAVSNTVERNSIGNNTEWGVYINNELGDNNIVRMNEIYGINQIGGIYLNDADNTTVRSNRIRHNQSYGIYFTNTAVDNCLSANEIFSNGFAGINLIDEDSDNNVISSNIIWGRNQVHGLLIRNSDRNIVRANQVRVNSTNGICVRETSLSNYFSFNRVISNGNIGLLLDSADAEYTMIYTNYIAGSSHRHGIRNNGSDHVVIQSNFLWANYASGIFLTNAAASNIIRQNRAMNSILYGILIKGQGSDNNSLIGNYIRNNDTGILIGIGFPQTVLSNSIMKNINDGLDLASRSNYVSDNSIYSNTSFGIYIAGTNVRRSRIVDNDIYRSGLYGIMMSGAFNVIESNRFWQNGTGVSMDSSLTNYIRQNVFFSNSGYGVEIYGDNTDGNCILTNIFYGSNQAMGVIVSGGDGTVIRGNTISRSRIIGIKIMDSTNSEIVNNKVCSNVIAFNCLSSVFRLSLNDLNNNNQGVMFVSGLLTGFEKNNLQSNSAYAFTNNTASFVKATNNWWGTTLASGIAAKVRNNGGYSNFTKYRLFGPFDITPGADTIRLPAITWATAVVTGNSVALTWNKPSDTSDFVRYFVYRSTTPGTTNLSLASRVWQTNSATGTNHWESGLAYGSNYYYHITSLDDPGAPNVLTNESWYSVQAAAQVLGYTGPYYVDDNSGNDSNPGTFSQPFATIQRAANAMMPGAPACTSATTYVFPGTYSMKTIIQSNRNPAYMIFTKLSNTTPVLNGAGLTNFAFHITNASRILIKKLNIKCYVHGIKITGNSATNYIIRNTIYSNNTNGVFINSDSADNNYILTNTIWGGNQDYGIRITSGDKNTIRSNFINNNENSGIYLNNSAATNYILQNVISSNMVYGIFINSDFADGNYISYNHINRNLQYGIDIADADNMIIRSNLICHSDYAIYCVGSVTYTVFSRNSIYSNEWYGIAIHTDTADNNYILTNDIWGMDQDYGIYIQDGDNNVIRFNQIHHLGGGGWGIELDSSAASTYIAKNNIYSNENIGIYLDSDTADNNYILTNAIWGMNQNYGIAMFGADRNTIRSNYIHDNEINGIYMFDSSKSNYIAKNTICQNKDRGILIDSDTGDNNYIYTNNIWGMNQDNGIQIIDGDRNIIGYNNIHNHVTNGILFSGTSVSNAVKKNSVYSNECYGIFVNSGTAYNNYISTNVIWGFTQDYGIYINDSDRNTIQSNRIHHNLTYGVFISGDASTNYVTRNIIYSNNGAGIDIMSVVAFKNRISFNVIYGLNQDYGIVIGNGIANTIRSNVLHHNESYGISINNNASSNYISKNTIYSNNQSGIIISSDEADNNLIFTNDIFGFNQLAGIYVLNGDSQQICDNLIYNNQTNGIRLNGSTNSLVRGNRIFGNFLNGVYYSGSFSSLCQNTITNNMNGVRLVNGPFQRFEKNNLQTNTACSFTNSSGMFMKLTNNWWGTTIASGIASRIRNNGGYSNFTAYRLFGPFDITPGADTTRLPAITWATAIVTGNNVELKWNRPSDTSDFIRYFVYRSATPGTTNLSLAQRVWQTNQVNGTNHWETVNYGSNYYYHITSLDDPGAPNVLTNESWYSVEAVALVPVHAGPYYVDDNSGNDSNPGTFTQPFLSIQRAANAMMPGAPACTSATTYVFPGTYSRKTIISSNKNPAYMVFTKLSNTRPVLFGALLTNYAFNLTNVHRTMIKGMAIKGYNNAILINGTSESNILIRNLIYSNNRTGVLVDSDAADNNQIMTNLILGQNQFYGVQIISGDKNTIQSNQICANATNGIYLTDSASSNNIFQNMVFSNYSRGVYINSDTADYNYILKNRIKKHKSGLSASGIRINNGDQNIARSNFICNNSYGVVMNGSAADNKFVVNTIYSNTSYVLFSDSDTADNNQILTNEIYGLSCLYGIFFQGGDGNIIRANRIHNIQNRPVWLSGSATGNYISRNLIYSNSGTGIYIDTDQAENNFIYTNHIFGPNQDTGIALFGAIEWATVGNTIKSNYIHHHTTCGININQATVNNKVLNNVIFSNGRYGIYFPNRGADNTLIRSNIISGPSQNFGIYLYHATCVTNLGNMISGSISNNIKMVRATNSALIGNRISGAPIGVNCVDSISAIYLNTITNNGLGVRITNTTLLKFEKNNLQNNNVNSFTNAGDSFVKLTNNWWGTTIASNVRNRIRNNGGYSNFIPYRLFGEFNIQPDADTRPLPRISWVTAFVVNSRDIAIHWTSTSNNDFAGYNIYRTTNSSLWSNFSKSDVLARISPVTMTNYTNFNVPRGRYFYFITAVDDPQPPAGSLFTNECWYSSLATATIYATNTGPYYVDDDSGNDGNPGTFELPFRTIQRAADRMSGGVTFATTYIFPGVYSEEVLIASNRNQGYMVFTKLSNQQPFMNGMLLSNTAVKLTNTGRIMISDLMIRGYTNGFLVTGTSRSNVFRRNTVYSNRTYAFYLNNEEADFNSIISNRLYGNDLALVVNNGDNNIIRSNQVHNNSDTGIWINGLSSATNNNIEANTVFSNDRMGITVLWSGAVHNSVRKNEVYDNGEAGIDLTSCHDNTVFSNSVRGSGQYHGMRFILSSGNRIRYNIIHNNLTNGIFSVTSTNFMSRNNIYSNDLNGIYLRFSSYNEILTNTIWGMNQYYGICVTNGIYNTIRSNRIFENEHSGIALEDNTYYSYVAGNETYNNNYRGIYLFNDFVNNNYILSNHVWGTNQDVGIFVRYGDKNQIRHNRVHNNQSEGIYLMYSTISNYISRNEVYSNRDIGVHVNSDLAYYNYILTNYISGPRQNRGIYLDKPDSDTIRSNQVRCHEGQGIYITLNADYNLILNNRICSNGTNGIFIDGDLANANIIASNIICGAVQGYGIRLLSGDNNSIYRNLVRDNYLSGIGIQGTALNINVVNNTIFKSTVSNGITWADTSSGSMYNNIFLSNKVYGAARSSFGTVKAVYNDFYGNLIDVTNGGIVWGQGNRTGDPFLETTTSFTIVSALSAAVDTGTNIPGISDIYQGYGPDMGWKESAFSLVNPGPYYVDDNSGVDTNPGTFTMPFRTIQKAVNVMMPGVTSATTYVFPGNYNEKVTVSSNRNPGYMVFTRLSNSSPVMNGSFLTNYAFHLTNAGKVILHGFIIKNYTNAVLLSGIATNNVISKNTIYSNVTRGIYVNSEHADNNYILTNDIWGQDQLYAILIENGDRNTIRTNDIHNNNGSGVHIAGTAVSNSVLNNRMYYNFYGVAIVSINCRNNLVAFNRLWNNTYGVDIGDGHRNSIRFNSISRSYSDGIWMDGDARTNFIVNNLIYSNEETGIGISSADADNNYVLSNNFWGMNQNTGINLDSGDQNVIRFNTIRQQSNYGIYMQGSAMSNYLARNSVYSNYNHGILLVGTEVRWNHILTNSSWGLVQTCGIYLFSVMNNLVISNQAHNNMYGIALSGSSSNCYVSRNSVYSNELSGVDIGDNSKSHSVVSNVIWGLNQDNGIDLGPVKNINISRNLVYDNGISGIYVNNSTNVRVINNTVYRSSSSYGVSWANTSSGTMYNNIILSNGDTGIFRNSTEPVYVSHNCIYGNVNGPTNGGLVWGPHNSFSDPMLDTTASFIITSALSPAVDTATNIPGISDTYQGTGPDMGWKESAFSMVYQGPFYVDDDSGNDGNDGRFITPFRTVQRAADVMSAGMPLCSVATAYIFPGQYQEKVVVRSNRNPGYMVFTKLSNTLPRFYGSGYSNYGIKITNTGRIVIAGLSVAGYSNGIVLTGACSSNLVRNSRIYSNINNGVNFLGPAFYNNT
ncbi:MAG: right-handed parallel beta-helix repeat-containing protein, partial [bacterium]|nr:right-handed parallel beta-helix repeat-containing protein [bacterium]